MRLAVRVASKGGRTRFAPVRLVWDVCGPKAVPVKTRSSADLVSGGRADGAIVLPPDVRLLDAGAFVEFRPWRLLP